MGANSDFRGIFVPVITPFTDDDRVYSKGMENILEHLHGAGIDGVWLLGSYGGFPLLSEQERMELAETALRKASELGMRVIVNVGSLYTAMALRLARHAEDHGAHAVASVVPFYYAASHYRTANLLQYFRSIVEEVQVPTFFYNNERATGFKPGREFLQGMLDIGVKGFKSKGDYPSMAEEIAFLKGAADDIVYLSGTTSVHLQGHLLGADGVTSGVALALPELVVRLQQALGNEQCEEAVRLQSLVLDARSVLGRHVGRAVACYDVLNHYGVDVGTCREPWLRMSEECAREVIADLANIADAV